MADTADHSSGPGTPPTETETVNGLRSIESSELLDLVDELRELKLGASVPLPQLVVCGDQSSGKSSVLEALSQVSFPRDESLCTRFATQIVLRRSAKNSICARILPHEDATEKELVLLQAFRQISDHFGDLETIIRKAHTAMGLDRDDRERNEEEIRAFSKHTLSIEIFGPDRPQLTLVDLPGLVQSSTDDHTDRDVEFVREMVPAFTKDRCTIIFAVVSASSDYACQSILTEVRKVDPCGERTMGIITKMDSLAEKEPKKEDKLLQLAQGKDLRNRLCLGWHLLRNRSPVEMDFTFEQRNAHEKAFFETEKYSVIQLDRKGIDTLRSRLAKLLHELLKKELPNVRAEVDELLAPKEARLKELGKKLETTAALKERLSRLSGSYWSRLVKDNGKKEGKDFVLRSEARDFEEQFAVQMRRYGHAYHFPQMADALGSNIQSDKEVKLFKSYSKARKDQKPWSTQQSVTTSTKKIMRVTEQPLATYDPHFTKRVKVLRDLREERERAELHAKYPYNNQQPIDLTSEDDDKISAINALDHVVAYYEGAIEYYITAALKQVIEQNLLEGLAEETFSPAIVEKWHAEGGEKIKHIMAEDDDVARERETLERVMDLLKQAQEKLKDIEPTRKRRSNEDADPEESDDEMIRTSKRAARRGKT